MPSSDDDSTSGSDSDHSDKEEAAASTKVVVGKTKGTDTPLWTDEAEMHLVLNVNTLQTIKNKNWILLTKTLNRCAVCSHTN